MKMVFKRIALFSLWLMLVITAPFCCGADSSSIGDIIAEMPINDLPAPSGENLVGTMRIDFINPSRLDFFKDVTYSQKMSVQVWYPAQTINGCERSDWLDERAAPSISALFGLPQEILLRMCKAKTNSYWNAPILTAQNKYPVILFSSGLGGANSMNTVQMEELASHGFIVVSVGHPGLDFAVVCADGDVIYPDATQIAAIYRDDTQAERKCGNKLPLLSPERYRQVIRNSVVSNRTISKIWAEDFKFIVEKLEDLNVGTPSSVFQDKLDLNNMGVFGHSFGGAASGQLCLDDSRFKAFINMDGTPYGTVVDHVISTPFAILSTNFDPYYMVYDGYNEAQSDFFAVHMERAAHFDLCDLNVVAPTLKDVAGSLGANFVISGAIPIDTVRIMVNDYVLSFFKHYMIGSQAPFYIKTPNKYPDATLIIFGHPYDE